MRVAGTCTRCAPLPPPRLGAHPAGVPVRIAMTPPAPPGPPPMPGGSGPPVRPGTHRRDHARPPARKARRRPA